MLAPDICWMGARVREHGIGLTYRHRDHHDFLARLSDLRADPTRFRANAAEFGGGFQRDKVDSALSAAFGDSRYA